MSHPDIPIVKIIYIGVEMAVAGAGLNPQTAITPGI